MKEGGQKEEGEQIERPTGRKEGRKERRDVGNRAERKLIRKGE